MPRLDDPNMEEHEVPQTAYGYSAIGIEHLGATEYTLVDINVDRSYSVIDHVDLLNDLVKQVATACRHSPRAENLLLRVGTFDDQLEEFHGFKELDSIEPDNDYSNLVVPRRATALYDSVANSVMSISDFAKKLNSQDFSANAIVVALTDGEDNSSAASMEDVKKAISKARRSETLESILTILIGVNVEDDTSKRRLEEFHKESGLDQYVDAGDATPEVIAKLAAFISHSISAQSQALGTGGPSQTLTF